MIRLAPPQKTYEQLKALAASGSTYWKAELKQRLEASLRQAVGQ